MKWPSWLQWRSRTSGLAEVDFWLKDAWGVTPVSSGATVNERTALGNTAVYACVRVLADSIAQLPVKVYRRREGRGKDEDRSHPLWVVLHDLANPEMTAFEFKQTMQGHLALRNNAYAEIERDGFGRVVGLWPLNPAKVTVSRNEQKHKVWTYELPDGTRAAWTWSDPRRQPSPILHLRGLGDGQLGYEPLTLLREPIGLTLSAEEYGSRLFSQSAQPRGILQAPGKLSPQTQKNLKESWDATHKGLSNAHRVAILEEGITWQQVGMNADDAQFLETRKFQVSEIARAFRIPPHMIGDLERATFSNIEHQAIEFVQHTLMPWLVCWEQAIGRDLLSVKSFSTHEVKYIVSGLLRGDLASQAQAFATGRQWGWYSADDVREFMDLNPLEDGQGQVYLHPSNMLDASEPITPPAPPLRIAG